MNVYTEHLKKELAMLFTIRCRFCREFFDKDELPELRDVCLTCWHNIQEYLTERHFTILGPKEQ